MINLGVVEPAGRSIGIFCIGAHSDDIEIGAGGTILELARQYPSARVAWHVLAAKGSRANEARASAAVFTDGFSHAEVHVHEFVDGSFPVQLTEIKAALETARDSFRADIVLTHYRGDLHQDHRTVAEVTWQTFRDQLILEYEIPKYDGDIGRPNAFFPISENARQKKLSTLEKCFESQRGKDWFDEAVFSAMMRIRGVECRSSSGYAEAFYCRKAVLLG